MTETTKMRPKISTSDSPALLVDGLSKTYNSSPGARPVFEKIGLDVQANEVVCIVGPSGAGKTTLLRCLSGLLDPTEGEVYLHGTKMTGPVPEIGIVFQDYSRSLLPWMRTRENVAFPLQGKGGSKRERRQSAEQYLTAVGLPEAGRKYPWQLSGGMQQRAAIARALAYQADVLLMDEPFASVDAQTRFDLEDLVLRLRRDLAISVIVVTHDIDEAIYLADRVVVLSGSPTTVVDVVDVPLGRERDQLRTKQDPAFINARTRVLGQIRHIKPE